MSGDGYPLGPIENGQTVALKLDAAGQGQLAHRLAAARATGAHQADPQAHALQRALDHAADQVNDRRQIDAAIAAHERNPTAHARQGAGHDAAPLLAAAYFA